MNDTSFIMKFENEFSYISGAVINYLILCSKVLTARLRFGTL